ncbi:AbfB domain-containing protein [Solwaraspora sp. WMMD1047]|uniref:AbfB domain-containing protein n=1 Tax=Solwaraspora sp. WMMD1047 TaxID=3016102 RepID=UPI002417928B|nr:AbfB domain-containing protein [Solwaraspora sp. WMMD1047]MDG4828640.1 AbfB domain-containing protein [Solwaraspora sp. WMMD1047]
MTHPEDAEPGLVRGGGWTATPDPGVAAGTGPAGSAAAPPTGLAGMATRFLFGEQPGPDGEVVAIRRQVARITLVGGALLAVIVLAAALVVRAASPDRDSAITGEANRVPAWVWAPGDGAPSDAPEPSDSPTGTPTPTPTPAPDPPGGSGGNPAPEPPPATSAAAAAPTPTPAGLRSNVQRSLRLAASPDRYVRHRSGLGFVDQVTGSSPAATREQASFTVVTGLADRDCYSFRGADGRYLRHFAFRIRYDADDRSDVFERDATFCPRSFGRGGGSIVLESENFRGRFIRNRNGELFLDPIEYSSSFAESVTFQATTAWS